MKGELVAKRIFRVVSWILTTSAVLIIVGLWKRDGLFSAALASLCYFLGGLDFAVSTIPDEQERG